MKKRILIALMVLVSSIQAKTVRDTVKYVIDGDTIQFKTMRCRLAYVDTPESGNNQKSYRDAERYNTSLNELYKAGRLAKRYTKSFVSKGQSFNIDVVKSKGKYGRSICVVYLREGRSLNQMLVSDGFAVPFWKYIPYGKKAEYRKLAKEAKSKKRGLWRINPTLIEKMSK